MAEPVARSEEGGVLPVVSDSAEPGPTTGVVESGSTEPAGEDRSRCAADRWIAQRLDEAGYDLAHEHAQLLADHLYSFGVGTLVNLNRSAALFAECRKLTHGALYPPPKSWVAESHRIIVATVLEAIPRFITQSMRSWDHTQSAIDTYFINYCLLRFKSVYEQFCREEAPLDTELPTDNIVDLQAARGRFRSDVEAVAIARATLRELEHHVDNPEFTHYLRLSLLGRTQRQVAAELGLSESQLSRRLAGWKEAVKVGGWPVRGEESRS